MGVTPIPEVKTDPENSAIAAFALIALIGLFIFALSRCSGGEPDPKVAARAAEDRRNGFHCLSPWDGSSRQAKEALRGSLRDPNSLEVVETKIAPVKDGVHSLVMTYRARNGFGGMNVGRALFSVNHETCAATLLANEDQ